MGRAYRIGQKKDTFVYRFIAGGTFEDSVHNKQIFKMQLASRVVDKKNPVAAASRKISDFLFEPTDVPQADLSEFAGMDPLVLDKVLESQKDFPTIRAIVQSDTFERDDASDKLTAEELKEVKQLLTDEQDKRSDPKGWLLKQAQRSQQDWNRVHQEAQLLRQQQLQNARNQPSGSSQGMKGSLPAGTVNKGEQPAILPPTKVQGDLPAPASTTITSPPSTPPRPRVPAARDSPNRLSPVPGSGTKIRAPTPDHENDLSGRKGPVSPSPFNSSASKGPRREGVRGSREQKKVRIIPNSIY